MQSSATLNTLFPLSLSLSLFIFPPIFPFSNSASCCFVYALFGALFRQLKLTMRLAERRDKRESNRAKEEDEGRLRGMPRRRWLTHVSGAAWQALSGGMQDLQWQGWRGEEREGYGSTCDCDCARGLTLSIERHKLVQGCSAGLGRTWPGCCLGRDAGQRQLSSFSLQLSPVASIKS